MIAVASCTPAAGTAAPVLARAVRVMGLDSLGTRVLHLRGSDVAAQDFQSDRSYAPFLSSVPSLDYWYSAATRSERMTTGFRAAGFSNENPTILSSETAAFVVRDTARKASEEANADAFATRPLNAWAVVEDWIADGGVAVSARCIYRDYPRLVLTRRGPRGSERLFVDEKSGFPVKLERDEPHYLWGQNRVEYVYSTWQRLGPASLPGVSFRIVDGVTNVERNIGSIALVPADSAPRLDVPVPAEPMGYGVPPHLEPTTPDTIRVGAHAFLLKNRGYSELVTLVRDTVFVFDATQGEVAHARTPSGSARYSPGVTPSRSLSPILPGRTSRAFAIGRRSACRSTRIVRGAPFSTP